MKTVKKEDWMLRALFSAAFAAFVIACGPTSVRAEAPAPVIAPDFASSGSAGFDAWRTDFARRAIEAGRDRAVVARLLSGLTPDERVVELDQRQPEFVSPVWDYVTNRVTDSRVSGGLALKSAIGPTLAQVEERYGVDADIIVGIWGLETNYGEAALSYDAAAALATLAYEGRRRAQFEGYLLALIEMVERGLADQYQLRSSYAGALGQPQFMPDVYLSTAVDWDGDGHRDIWTNRGDVAASIAHYLQDRGWQRGQPVFDEVRLPEGFDYALADGTPRSIADWAARGVRRIDGAEWPSDQRNLQSELFLPAGASGPALMLHPNFFVIRRYNASDRYALVVALLARRFEGRAGLATPWPTNLGSLNRDQTLELQTLLNGLGFDAGPADGLFGSNTRRAVRAFQVQAGQVADGFPTTALLQAVRVRAGVASASVLPDTPPRGLDTSGVRELQRLLNRLGYDVGDADGRIGPNTRAAIRAFEARQGMEVRGYATDHVLIMARSVAG
ncbi:MAG: lytic murein transglycosylase [Hyphomonadaceae bacterium]|nr:lytic murein transglycosylase [Hyphomonadaceae bacterium]